MTFNPVRAENFNKRNRPRHELNPHAGIKHSDIMKRQGVGVTIPLDSRVNTPNGISALLFSGEDFVVRSELVASGNASDFGMNECDDRVYVIRNGVLFVRVGQEDGSSKMMQFQSGDVFRAPKGTKYSVAASGTHDVELLVIETANYDAGWQTIETGVAAGLGANVVLSGESPSVDVPRIERRRDQTLAKAQAEEIAAPRRRKLRMSASTELSAGGNVRATRGSDPNSGTVLGVNPRPMGPGGVGED